MVFSVNLHSEQTECAPVHTLYLCPPGNSCLPGGLHRMGPSVRAQM